MYSQSVVNILESIVRAILIYVFVFLGNYTHDEYIIIIKRQKKKIKIKAIILSSLIVSVFLYVLSDSLIERFGVRTFVVGICFMFGLIAQELSKYLITLDGWRKIYKTYTAGKNILDEEEKKDKKNDDENK